MRYLPWILLVIGGLLVWYFWPTPTVVQSEGRIDTVYINKVLPRDTVMIPSAPQIVRIYLPDTAARAKAEKGDIVTAVNVSRNLVTVEKLDPRGIGIRQEYHLPELAAVRIDGNGQAQITPDRKAKRQKFWRKMAVIGSGVGGLIVGLAL